MKLAYEILESAKNLTNDDFILYACSRLNHTYSDSTIIHQLAHELNHDPEARAREKILVKISSDKWLKRGNVSLISQHIPKSAGSTLLRCIKRQYTEQTILEFYDDWREIQNTNNEIQVFHGHIKVLRPYFDQNPDAKKITWLREPMLRLISQYYFWKLQPRKPRNPKKLTIHEKVYTGLSFEDYIDQPECSNIYTKYWLKDIEMNMFDFIGITENFDTDIQRMVDILNWKPLDNDICDNKNRYDGYSDIVNEIIHNKKLVNKITQNNQFDYELYYNHGGVCIF